VEFEGGHEWMPAALAGEAFGFFAGSVPAQAATASKDAERQSAEYERLIAQIQEGGEAERRAVIKQAQKDAAREQDGPARRVARRVIGGISIGSMEATREFMAQKRYSDAARSAETGVMVRPENAGAWYSPGSARRAAATRSGRLKRWRGGGEGLSGEAPNRTAAHQGAARRAMRRSREDETVA
jgi:hypothetical protein